MEIFVAVGHFEAELQGFQVSTEIPNQREQEVFCGVNTGKCELEGLDRSSGPL